MARDATKAHAGEFTGVKRVRRCVIAKPFKAQVQEAPGWRTIGSASTRAGAETIARGWRIDHRGAQTRVADQRRPGGFTYIAT